MRPIIVFNFQISYLIKKVYMNSDQVNLGKYTMVFWELET